MPRIPTISGTMTGSRGKPTTRTAGPDGVVSADLHTNGGGGITVTIGTINGRPEVTISVRTNSYNGVLYSGPLQGIEGNMPPYEDDKPACRTKEAMRDALFRLVQSGQLSSQWREMIRITLGIPTSDQIPRRQ